jgi:septal ring factor EnvC (AmiA/AmiB activator)
MAVFARRRRAWLTPLALAASLAFADDPELNRKNRELERTRARIHSMRGALDNLESEKSVLTGQLSEIERKYGELAKSLRALETAARQQAGRLVELQRRRLRMRDGVLKRHRALAGQVRSAYAMGRDAALKLLLNLEDPARASRVLTYYGYLNRARASDLDSVRKSLDELRLLENDLTNAAKKLDAAKAAVERERRGLGAARRSRLEIVSKIERETRNQSERLRRLEEDAGRLQALIAELARAEEERRRASPGEGASLQAAAFAQARGRMIWPVEGKLKARFGAPRMTGAWDGVLVTAPEGAPVRAIFPGRAVFSDWLRGYGLLLVIDHGAGYMSLYAFNQALYKNVGDLIEAGETIAVVGDSGGQSEPGLYFGIREQGRPLNPLEWCARRH